MADDRPWYLEPETFIAVAALVVSISAVVVGVYEAHLQRAHDRAEVWPHVELSTFTSPKRASLSIENNGLGPAVIKSVAVSVDGKPRRNWAEVLRTLFGDSLPPFDNATVADHALRAGDHVALVAVPLVQGAPIGFWGWASRVSVRVCYASVFGESWTLTAAHLGGPSVWRAVDACPAQSDSVDF